MRQARSARRRHFRDRAFGIVFHSRVTLEELRGAIAWARANALPPDANGDYWLESDRPIINGTLSTLYGFRIVETPCP